MRSKRSKRFTVSGVAVLAAASLTPCFLPASTPPDLYSATDHVVTDTNTGLEWQRAASSSDLNWAGAVAYCANLTTDGGGWRLPSMKEIQTLVVETRTNPAVDTTYFSEAEGLRFWTSSEVPGMSDHAWLFDSNVGHVYPQETSFQIRARCVR